MAHQNQIRLTISEIAWSYGTGVVAHQRSVKNMPSRGVWGHFPQEILQNKHSEIKSETSFNCLSLNLILVIFFL